MASFARSVEVKWEGGLQDGKGVAKAGTGAFSQPVSFPQRVGEPEGVTSPEELIAAAHAACYAMVINATLGKQDAKAAKTQVVCTVTADKGEAGIRIVSSHLKASVEGLEGMEKGAFAEMAKAAEGKCPVSNALRGSVEITVEASAK